MTDSGMNVDFVDQSVTLFDDGDALISAVHRLIKQKDSPTKFDLILAAAMHALRGSDKSSDELASVVSLVWPGARIDNSTLLQAMKIGNELGLVSRSMGLGDVELWTLSTSGVDEVDLQQRWVDDAKQSMASELQARALADSGRTVDEDTARLWLDHLVRAIVVGITATQDAYLGNVDHLVSKRLAPRGFDKAKLFAALERGGSAEVAAFLRTCAIAALDPLDPFGSQVVSHITTGCVLHSYIAGRDSASVQAKLGTPRGQRALLDTPILIELLGPKRVREPSERTISAAVAAGWEVMVAEHTIDELQEVIQREVPKLVEELREAHEKGVKQQWFASLANEQLVSYCVEALNEGTYRKVEELENAARSIGVRLADLGVTVRSHHNDNDATSVEMCRRSLDGVLAGGRSSTAIERDSESMAMVWRARRRESKSSSWPGGWVITPDRRMAEAFDRAAEGHTISLTLSIGQWTTLVAVAAPAAEVVELAQAAAMQMVDEAMWLVPSRFPSEVAMELALQISPDHGGTITDLRYAQMTLTGVLDEGAQRSGTSLASDVLAGRTARRDRQSELAIAEANRVKEQALHRATAAESAANEQQRLAHEMTQKAVNATGRIETLNSDLSWERKQKKRLIITLLLGFLAVALVAAVLLTGAPGLVVLLAVLGLLILGVGGYRWCTERESKLWPIIVGTIVEAVGLLSAALSLFSGGATP